MGKNYNQYVNYQVRDKNSFAKKHGKWIISTVIISVFSYIVRNVMK